MSNTFAGAALVLALAAGTVEVARAESQPNPPTVTDRDTRTTVFHGTPGEGVAEGLGYGGSRVPGYTTNAGGTTVFHGAPAGPPTPWPAPPPWMLPPPPSGAGR